jgi:hypothetical protein
MWNEAAYISAYIPSAAAVTQKGRDDAACCKEFSSLAFSLSQFRQRLRALHRIFTSFGATTRYEKGLQQQKALLKAKEIQTNQKTTTISFSLSHTA